MQHKELIIIGGGPGGYVPAIRAAQLGMKVTVIEKEDKMGGTCLNVGCIPTKSLLKSAHLFQSTKNMANFGVQVENPTFHLDDAMKWKNTAVSQLTGGVAMLMGKNKIEVVKGEARFENSQTISVDGESMTFDNLIIAAGSVPAVPPIPGVDLDHVINSTQALDLKALPKQIAVIGGGVIAIEFADIFRSLGCQVTILEMQPEILPLVDRETAQALRKSMTRQGVTIHVDAKVVEINNNAVVFEKDGEIQQVECDTVLLAAGRVPALSALNLDKAGIEYNKQGIVVDTSMKTNVKGVYAVGDIIATPQLAHVASDEGIVAVENIAGNPKNMRYNAIPSCVYTNPEVATVGLTEEQAKAQNIDYKVGKFPLVGNGKAMVEGATNGFVKVLTDQLGDEVLGIHIMGPNASEMIFQGSLGLSMEVSLEEFVDAVYPHPSVSEAVMEAALATINRAIHF